MTGRDFLQGRLEFLAPLINFFVPLIAAGIEPAPPRDIHGVDHVALNGLQRDFFFDMFLLRDATEKCCGVRVVAAVSAAEDLLD